MINKQKKSVLFCAHGSKDQEYNVEFNNLIKTIKKDNYDHSVFKCFIEINRPSIDMFFKNYRDTDNKKLFVFPTLIFHGRHLEIDIKKKIPSSKNIILCDNMKLDEEIISIYKNYILKKKKSSKIVLVTISSYSKSKTVLKQLQDYTKKLSTFLPVNSFYFCFYGREKDVLKKIKVAKNKSNLDLIIHPIFLFSGYLYKESKKKFENLGFKNTISTQPFFHEKKVKDLFARRVSKALNS